MSCLPWPASGRLLLPKVAGVLAAICWVSLAAGDDTTNDKEFQERVRPLLAKYCFDCHGEATHEKDLRLDQLSLVFDGSVVAKWQRVLERVELGQMPPESAPRPTAGEAHVLTASLKSELRKVELARRAKEGRVLMRR